MGLERTCRGLLLLALAVVLAHAPAQADGPPAPPDSLASLDAEWAALSKRTPDDYRRFLARYQALPDGTSRALDLAREAISRVDPNLAEARALLGFREFAHDVPEEISYRRYPFVRIVEEAGAQRWFDDPVAYANALEAFIACQKHAARLSDDPAYSALDVARRRIDLDEHLRPYNYDAIFASPFLICYSTKERIDEAALWRMPTAERAKAWAELDARRVPYRRVLAEKARIYTQTYERLLALFGETCDLKPLMAAYGGRPDYPPSKRSFMEGCPLTVWVFSDFEAWNAHHAEVRGEPRESSSWGYYAVDEGRVYTFDRGPEDREAELLGNTRLATLLALHWFARQGNKWGRAYLGQGFFTQGFPDWFGSVTMAKDRTLVPVALNRAQLRRLQGYKASTEQAGRKLPVFPLKDLLSLRSTDLVRAYAADRFHVAVGGLFRAQCWAFFVFLDQAQDGKRRPAIGKLLDAHLASPAYSPGYLFEQAASILGITSDAQWAALDAEFAAFYVDLLQKDPSSIGPLPPALNDWPGYVAPDLLPPTGPVK